MMIHSIPGIEICLDESTLSCWWLEPARGSATLAAVAHAVRTPPPPVAEPKREQEPRRGRVYGRGSRKYSGPRAARRRPTLAPATLRALNVAWNAC